MSRRDGFISLRTGFESAFAALLFGAAAVLVLSGALAMCIPALLSA